MAEFHGIFAVPFCISIDNRGGGWGRLGDGVGWEVAKTTVWDTP